MPASTARVAVSHLKRASEFFVYDDWGPAFCIEVVNPAGKQVGYLFYGIASS